jgi:hypothetical protein
MGTLDSLVIDFPSGWRLPDRRINSRDIQTQIKFLVARPVATLD